MIGGKMKFKVEIVLEGETHDIGDLLTYMVEILEKVVDTHIDRVEIKVEK